MRRSVVGTLTLLLLASVPALAQVPADEIAYERQAQHAFRLQAAERSGNERLEALESIARQVSAAGAVMRQLEAEIAALRADSGPTEVYAVRAARRDALEALLREATAAGAVMRQLEAEVAAMRELALDQAAARRRAAPAVEDEVRADHVRNRTHRIALASFGE